MPPFLRPCFAIAAVLGGAACADPHTFVSPTTPQGLAPFVPPQRSFMAGTPADAGQGGALGQGAPHPLSFFRTQDSNEWVAHAFKVQATYARVIVVSPDGKAPAKIAVRKLDLNALPGTLPTVELTVNVTLKTLADAALVATGGDLVAVMPGRYKGFTLRGKADAGDGRYIHFKALGAPGEVVIDAPSEADRHWMVWLSGAHHVILQGFRLEGRETPGDMEAKGPWAGIMIDGDFLRTSSMAHHIAVLESMSHNHAKWGIHSVDSHTVLVQDNLFARSAQEHAAYFSDGSDDYVIRRNVFFGSNACGLQINVDPKTSLTKVAQHLHYKEGPLSRDWALGLLKVASDKFGANAFPDGRGFNYIIEDNVMNGNGRDGGAALNLAGVRESLIQNNLVYGNFSSGIAEWNDNNPFDEAQVNPGPQTVAEVTGAEVLPIFGCFNNVIRNNTVLTGTKSRPALLVGNGSWGTRAFNNVLVNDEFPSVELLNTSIWRFEGRHNVLDKVNYQGPAAALKKLAIALPDERHSHTGVKRSALDKSFVRPSDEPWVFIEGNWWKLNPKRPDFHPRAAGMLAGKGEPTNQPKADLEGKRRTKADIGAYVAAP